MEKWGCGDEVELIVKSLKTDGLEKLSRPFFYELGVLVISIQS